MIPRLQDLTRQHPTRHWLDGLEPLGVPCGPVNTIPEVFADPQVRHRGMELRLPHPAGAKGEVPMIASPIRMSETPVDYRHAPPMLGQHTDEVLGELLGMDEGGIAALRDRGVI